MLLPEPDVPHDGDVLALVEVDRDAPEGVDGDPLLRPLRRPKRPPEGAVTHDVGLADVPDLDDRLMPELVRLAGPSGRTTGRRRRSRHRATAAGAAASPAAALVIRSHLSIRRR